MNLLGCCTFGIKVVSQKKILTNQHDFKLSCNMKFGQHLKYFFNLYEYLKCTAKQFAAIIVSAFVSDTLTGLKRSIKVIDTFVTLSRDRQS